MKKRPIYEKKDKIIVKSMNIYFLALVSVEYRKKLFWVNSYDKHCSLIIICHGCFAQPCH